MSNLPPYVALITRQTPPLTLFNVVQSAGNDSEFEEWTAWSVLKPTHAKTLHVCVPMFAKNIWDSPVWKLTNILTYVQCMACYH